MTREEKIKKKQTRSFSRKQKRIKKDQSYIDTARSYDRLSISWGRRKQIGQVHCCEMGYSCCEERGYCNGDC